MAKWANVHSFTTGLAKAMKAWNDNDIETMNMHLALLDKMIETQTLGTNLELAKMRLQSQAQVNPLELELQYQNIIGKHLDNLIKLGEIQDKQTLESYIDKYATELAERGIFQDKETALLTIKKGPMIQDAYSALRTAGQVGAEMKTTAPTGQSLYDVTAQASMYKGLGELATSKSELEQRVPELEAQRKATVAGTTIREYPKQEAAETVIKEAEAKYREELLRSEIQRNLASARFLNPDGEARQWLNSAASQLNRASDVTADISRLESQISSNSPDLATTILQIANKHGVQSSPNPNVVLDQLRAYRDRLDDMAQMALKMYGETVPGEAMPKVINYGLGPYQSLEEMKVKSPNWYNKVLSDIAAYKAKSYIVRTMPANKIGVLSGSAAQPAPSRVQQPKRVENLSESTKNEFLRPFAPRQENTMQKPSSNEDLEKLKKEINKALREEK